MTFFNYNTTEKIEQLFKTNQIALTPLVYMEVLQGSKTQQILEKIDKILLQQAFYHLNDKLVSYENAALIYSRCRKKGITIRSSIDCLIAQCAIENEVTLLHNDKDFVQMAGVIPTLKQRYIGD